jgi:Domain of unknown function (DUF4278)
MKLIYRGVSYEYNPSQTRTGNRGYLVHSRSMRSPYTLIYRGTKIDVDPNEVKSPNDHRPQRYTLIYRGVMYEVYRPILKYQEREYHLPVSLPV